jgi:predicted nucleic acid-binding protein
LQGFRNDADYRLARQLMTSLAVFDLLGQKNALKSAENHRALRKRGITIRKTVDLVIATFCIEQNLPLLFADRDFIPLVRHLGLRSVTQNA